MCSQTRKWQQQLLLLLLCSVIGRIHSVQWHLTCSQWSFGHAQPNDKSPATAIISGPYSIHPQHHMSCQVYVEAIIGHPHGSWP